MPSLLKLRGKGGQAGIFELVETSGGIAPAHISSLDLLSRYYTLPNI